MIVDKANLLIVLKSLVEDINTNEIQGIDPLLVDAALKSINMAESTDQSNIIEF